ncbi:hypothetical protein [Microbacterium sp. CJ88]|uniref:hypothetical protein n=1 Tax=Microbacterium sp. CJ88 TaxID=3445672 RepID=UPI003F65C5CF
MGYKARPLTRALSVAHTAVGAMFASSAASAVSDTLMSIGIDAGSAGAAGIGAGFCIAAASVGASIANARKDSGAFRAMSKGGHRVRSNEERLNIARRDGYNAVRAKGGYATEYNDGIQSYRNNFDLDPAWNAARAQGFNDALKVEGNSEPDEYVAWCDAANAADPSTPATLDLPGVTDAPWVEDLTAAPNAPPPPADALGGEDDGQAAAADQRSADDTAHVEASSRAADEHEGMPFEDIIGDASGVANVPQAEAARSQLSASDQSVDRVAPSPTRSADASYELRRVPLADADVVQAVGEPEDHEGDSTQVASDQAQLGLEPSVESATVSCQPLVAVPSHDDAMITSDSPDEATRGISTDPSAGPRGEPPETNPPTTEPGQDPDPEPDPNAEENMDMSF